MASFDEESDYHFDPTHLDEGDPVLRRFAIMEVSRLELVEYEMKILSILEEPESEEAQAHGIRRHAVRALAALRSRAAVPLLIRILDGGDDLVVGDALQALGKIGAVEARDPIVALLESPVRWIAEQARFALKRLGGDPSECGRRATDNQT